MWTPWKKKDKGGNTIVTPKCNEHEALVKKVARIEGEITIVLILLVAILAKLLA